jgi:hypothetical protein
MQFRLCDLFVSIVTDRAELCSLAPTKSCDAFDQ